ncbi:MAG: Asp-tRNA(Asn)/Glu-tRNA(Gln) amidotransferase subunit GatA [Candidatus Babeliales bacterium]
MKILAFSTIKYLKQLLVKKEISSKEVIDFFVKRIRTYDPELQSLLEFFEEYEVPTSEGMLAGIPGVIKDNISQRGRKLTCASKILEHFVARYDATVIDRLKKQGGVILGRANLDEFAMGSSTETSAFYKTKNPWNYHCVPGGSSGGSAAAVAAGLTPWALGSDTGGSVRQPAAFCGIVGIKPTYGLVSRYGLVAYASSLDQIGVLTRTVYDNALVLSAIAGKDALDASSLPVESKDYTAQLDLPFPRGLRIGVVKDMLYADGMHNDIVKAIEQVMSIFQSWGAHIIDIDLPILKSSAATYFIVSRAEAASNLARFDGVRYGYRSSGAYSLSEMYKKTRGEGFGEEVKSRIMVGNYVLSVGHADEFYKKAKLVQDGMRQAYVDAFKHVDMIIMPTHSQPAFHFDSFVDDKLNMDLQDYFTCSANLTGIPALALPCGFTQDNLPIGLQLVGPHLSESLLYHVGHAYERETSWMERYPILKTS